jgi:hypothetical protein
MCLYLFRRKDIFYISSEEDGKKIKHKILLNNLQDFEALEYIGKIKHIYYSCDLNVYIKRTNIEIKDVKFNTYVIVNKNYYFLVNNSMTKLSIDNISVYAYKENTSGAKYYPISILGGNHGYDVAYHISIPIKYDPIIDNLLNTCSSFNKDIYLKEIKQKAVSLLKVQYEIYKQQKINELNVITNKIEKGIEVNEKDVRNSYALDISKVQHLANKIHGYNQSEYF